MKNLLQVVFASLFLFSSQSPQSISWQPLNGPFGGTPLCFASNSNGNIFAGSDNNQQAVFRSTDLGLTWQRKNNGIVPSHRMVNWLIVNDSSYIIAGTDDPGGYGPKVYKSMDNGESWIEISILGGKNVAVNDSGHIYVGDTGYAKYSVSKDGGYTWTHYSHPSPFINCLEINDSGHIFIGGNYTGYRSTDNGVSWTTLSLPDGINSFAFAPNGDVYAGCSRGDASNSGVYKSTDNGDSWTPVKEGFRVYPTDNIVINNDGDIFVGSYGWGIWRSTDDGVTWTQQNSGLGHYYIKSMYMADNRYIYAGASGGGIYKSTDNGESWIQVGVTAAQVNRIAISPLNGYLFAAVNGMSRSMDSGETWQAINNGISYSDIRQIAIRQDGTIFIGLGVNYANPSNFIYRSTNNGEIWVATQSGVQTHEIAGLTVDDSGNVYASNYYGVYKSTNDGETWNKIADVPSGKLAFNTAGDLFLASYGGGMWKLPAGDTVWVDLGGTYIYTFFIGRNDYLYTDQARSTDNGLTWETMPLGNMAYSYTENSQGHLFAGTFNYGSGVKRSTDYGETWESINSGIPTNDVRCVTVDSDDYLYVGPWGYSLYKTTTSTLTAIEDEKYSPAFFYLEQNYPNPFNPTTTIRYSVPKAVLVELKVFNLLGQEVTTLVNEEKPIGNYEVNFDASSLSSGIYFCKLQAGTYIGTKKMILLK